MLQFCRDIDKLLYIIINFTEDTSNYLLILIYYSLARQNQSTRLDKTKVLDIRCSAIQHLDMFFGANWTCWVNVKKVQNQIWRIYQFLVDMVERNIQDGIKDLSIKV